MAKIKLRKKFRKRENGSMEFTVILNEDEIEAVESIANDQCHFVYNSDTYEDAVLWGISKQIADLFTASNIEESKKILERSGDKLIDYYPDGVGGVNG